MCLSSSVQVFWWYIILYRFHCFRQFQEKKWGEFLPLGSMDVVGSGVTRPSYNISRICALAHLTNNVVYRKLTVALHVYSDMFWVLASGINIHFVFCSRGTQSISWPSVTNVRARSMTVLSPGHVRACTEGAQGFNNFRTWLLLIFMRGMYGQPITLYLDMPSSSLGTDMAVGGWRKGAVWTQFLP